MTVLVPMSLEVYAGYLKDAIAAYAEDNIASGRWPAAGALAQSRESFHTLLPLGLNTPDNYLFEIRIDENGPMVGFLWFAVVEKHHAAAAFVYDLEIKAAFRRQGHAEAAFALLEERVRELGLDSIGLHVFATNDAARALYKKLGYQVTGVNMQKKLGSDVVTD